MYYFSKIALWLLIIGGINWGLVGIFGFDLVVTLFGVSTILSRIVYILVGLSAILLAYYELTSSTVRVIKEK